MKALLTLITPLALASVTAAQDITVARAGSQPPQQGPTENFTGTVRVERLFGAAEPARTTGGLVTFEAGARSAWHAHPLGQILIVTAGIGRVQQWGGPIQEIRKGDTVRIPPNVKHWHGASADTAMTHIAIVEQLDGKSTDWMEKVSDEQYNAPVQAQQAASAAPAHAGPDAPTQSLLLEDVVEIARVALSEKECPENVSCGVLTLGDGQVCSKPSHGVPPVFLRKLDCFLNGRPRRDRRTSNRSALSGPG